VRSSASFASTVSPTARRCEEIGGWAGSGLKRAANLAQRVNFCRTFQALSLAAQLIPSYSPHRLRQQNEFAHEGVDGASRSRKTCQGTGGRGAWKAWVEEHHAAVSAMGGPLGKTKKITGRGIEDVSNEMGAFMVVRAESHEAAARLFEKHPHFTIFPGESVEVMPGLPIPGA
jgi:hypothetical protein